MASATAGTNFSTTARTIGQAGHELNTVSGEISRKELLRTVLPKYVRSRSLGTTHTISGDHSLVPRLGQRIVHLSHQLLHLRQHQTGGTVMATVLPGVENSLEGSLEFSRENRCLLLRHAGAQRPS
jgi:hypothetical protein